MLRVNDLLPAVVDDARVRTVLADRGIPVGTRDEPVRGGVRALVSPTAAGVVLTLERRGGPFAPRGVVLRRLRRLWDSLVPAWDTTTPSTAEPPQNRTSRRSGGS